MRHRLRGRPGIRGGGCEDGISHVHGRREGHLRLAVECLVPLCVLPRVLGRVESVRRRLAPEHFQRLRATHVSHALHPSVRLGQHSPFFGGGHRIDIAAGNVSVPGYGSGGEGSGADGEGVRLPGRTLGCGAGGRGRALYHQCVSRHTNADGGGLEHCGLA